MLDSGAAGLANELCQTSLVDKMTAARLDADGTHILQPLDQAKHAGGRGCLRHLPQPSEPTQTAFVLALSERIEALALLGRKPIGQPAMCLSPRTVAEVSAQPLQRHGRWDGDAALTARLHHHFGQESKPIVLDRWDGDAEPARSVFSGFPRLVPPGVPDLSAYAYQEGVSLVPATLVQGDSATLPPAI